MGARDGVYRVWRRAAAWARRRNQPSFFVRVATRSNEAWRIVYAAKCVGPPWDDTLVANVIDVVLESQGVDISLFAVSSRDRFDRTHALGVLAPSIAARDFDDTERQKYLKKLEDAATPTKKQVVKDEFGRKVIAFIIASDTFEPGSTKPTPEGNLNFAPANELHHDARPHDAIVCAKAFLDGLRSGVIRCTFLRPPDFRVQAALALSACIDRYGDLSSAVPPPAWDDGASISAAEQLARLRTIAGDAGIQNRLELNRPGP